MGAVAKATGFEISSSILSSIPQNRENGSSVSGGTPKLMYDSPISVPDDEEEECRGDKMGSRDWEVVLVDARLGNGRTLLPPSSVGGGRKANGGTPLDGDRRVAEPAMSTAYRQKWQRCKLTYSWRWPCLPRYSPQTQARSSSVW